MQCYEPKFLPGVILFNWDIDVQYYSTSGEEEQAMLMQCKGPWNVKGVLRGIQITFVCCLWIKVFSWFSREGMVRKKRVRIMDLNFWLWIWLLLLSRYLMTRSSLSSSLHSPILTRTVVRLHVWNQWTEHSFKLKVKWSFETTECIHLMEGQVWPQRHLKSKSLC